MPGRRPRLVGVGVRAGRDRGTQGTSGRASAIDAPAHLLRARLQGTARCRDAAAQVRGGGGALLDLEYLEDDRGRRLAAFGFWAGYLGAALAVLHHRGVLRAPLQPTSKEAMEAELRASTGDVSALVIGALGRSGRGARVALGEAGVEPTCWDLAETRDLDR